MLYQGAIDFLNSASGHLEQGEIAEKGVCLSKAHAIIAELRTSLDFEVGGDLSRNLEDLYLYMLEQIATANMNNDPKLLEVVISLMVRLKEAWETAIVTERKRVAQEPA